MADDAIEQELAQRVRAAAAGGQPLQIEGGGSKSFYGGARCGEPLDVTGLAGIVAYEPSELVVTVRAGTSLSTLETALAAHGQRLAFEPPRHTPHATVGGMVAAGLSGPARLRAGSVRDHVLGARLLTGRGEWLAFGGRVIKNVAGYDVARLLAGSMGALGVIGEVSLKVVPMPEASTTLGVAADLDGALALLSGLHRRALAVDASAWLDGRLWLRLTGSEAAVTATARQLPGEQATRAEADALWTSLRDQTHPFFAVPGTLWRLCVAPTAPPLDLGGDSLLEWHGALRWWRGDAPATAVEAAARAAGGYARAYRGGAPGHAPCGVLDPVSLRLNRALKAAFDPAGIFNPGRLHPDL